MKILFLTPYPLAQAPSQRFRFEQYFGYLKENHIDYKVQPFLDEGTWAILYKPGNTIKKIWGILKGFAKRKLMLFSIHKYDFVFIHRETSPIGPPLFEWIIAMVFRKKIIYDFDDAIWLGNTSDTNRIVSKLKWHGKVGSICKWSYKVSCGNTYLCDYARQFNNNVVLNPTTIDTENLHVLHHKTTKNKPIVIGWTGTHSTLPYLKSLIPTLEKLEKKYNFVFQVISNQPPNLPLKSIVYKPWNKKTEIKDLSQFDIGIMPLSNDKWSKGKCGFKALQYLALEIPALASPVGVNSDIIKHGVNGFLCASESDWYQYLEKLIINVSHRTSLGRQGRKRVIDSYSVLSNQRNFLNLFEQ